MKRCTGQGVVYRGDRELACPPLMESGCATSQSALPNLSVQILLGFHYNSVTE